MEMCQKTVASMHGHIPTICNWQRPERRHLMAKVHMQVPDQALPDPSF